MHYSEFFTYLSTFMSLLKSWKNAVQNDVAVVVAVGECFSPICQKGQSV